MIVTLFVAGCAPKNVVKERTLGIEQVLALVNARNQKIQTLSGDGSITVESPEGSNSGSFDVRIKKPDSLRADFTGPFGIRGGTLMLSREKFLFYNWMENQTVRGTPDGKTLNAMFHLTMNFDEVLGAFTGEFPSPAPGDSLQAFTVENDRYVIRYRSGGITKDYRINGDAFTVETYRLLDDAGKSVLVAQSTDPDEADGGVVVPRFLRIVFPQDHRSMTITYSNVEVNQPVTCSFALPRQAETNGQ